MSTLTRDDLLVLLIEECSEVIKAATKCLRFGYDVDHGTGYGNNRDELSKEMGECSAVACALGIDHGRAFWDAANSKIRRAEEAKAKYGTVSSQDRGGE